MASWVDVISLLVAIGLFGGVAYAAIQLKEQFSGAVDSTRDNLKKRGLDITESGVSVKTDKRMEHSDYIDATQKNIVEALKSASFGSPEQQRAVPESLGQGYAAPGTRHRTSLSKKK